MTSPDRTEELIREMLERRAAAPPEWLSDETSRAARRVRQRRAGAMSAASGSRIALVGLSTAVVVAVIAGAAIASGLVPTAFRSSPVPSFDLAAVPPSPVPSEEPDEIPSEVPADEPSRSAAALPPDSIAVVTTEGDGLRVRSAPGTGADSRKLTPLLPKAARMLILNGPVEADGYDWYQVYVPNERLAGWVAAGEEGVSWIRAGKRRCPEKLDREALYVTSSIDLLLCYQGRQMEAAVYGVGDYDGAHCDLRTDRMGCTWTPRWFERQGYINLGGFEEPPAGETGAIETLDVAIDPSVSAEDLASHGAQPTITLSFDHPDAKECQVREDDGREPIEPWQAVLACRLLPVVEEIEPGAPIDVEGP